jgi:pimeloyl-ACP methyl ester carboxylesterase
MPSQAALAFTLFGALALMDPGSIAWAGAAEDGCRRISAAAKISQTTVLVIAYEGLGGYNPSLSNAMDAYRCQLIYAQGQPSSPASVGMGGALSRGLLLPLVTKYKNQVQFLVYPEYDIRGSGSSAEACAAIWKREDPSRKLILTGHSFGGHAAVMLAEALHRRGVSVDGVVTVDPRNKERKFGGGFRKTPNVQRWENFYQKLPSPLVPLPGYTVDGANNHLLFGGHVFLPYKAEVRRAMESMIGEPPGPKTIAGRADTCNSAMTGKAGVYSEISGSTNAGDMATVVALGAAVTGGLVYGGTVLYKKAKKPGISSSSPVAKKGDISGAEAPGGKKKEGSSAAGETEGKPGEDVAANELAVAPENSEGQDVSGSSRMGEGLLAAAAGSAPRGRGPAAADAPVGGGAVAARSDVSLAAWGEGAFESFAHRGKFPAPSPSAGGATLTLHAIRGIFRDDPYSSEPGSVKAAPSTSESASLFERIHSRYRKLHQSRTTTEDFK